MKRQQWPIFLILILLILLGLHVAARATVLTNDHPTPPTYFGLHIHHLVVPGPDGKRTYWPTIEFGSWRLWDAAVAWPNLEPKPEHWNFNVLDQYVMRAQQHHVQIILPLGLTPAWASSRPGEPSAYGPGMAAPPYDLNAWRNYVLAVATRYKGEIHYYELWNEVNVKAFYSGSQHELVKLAQIAYQTLKEVDPSNQFISPSIVGEGNNLSWFASYLAKGGAKYADIIGYHFYVPKSDPEAMLPLIQKVRNIMQAQGIGDKPLWDTETGWWIANTDGTPENGGISPSWKRLAPDQAADYVARALILGRAAGLGRFFWYAWDNQGMGLINVDTQTLKPAALAYARTVQWITGKTLSCQVTTPVIACKLGNGDEWVAWATSSSGNSWSPPSGWKITQIQLLDGTRISEAAPTSIPLDQSPKLVSLAQH